MDENELLDIFEKLKNILKKYEGKLKPKLDLINKYDLWSFREIEIDGRKRKEVYFAGIILQKKYVGFYFMPIYSDKEQKRFYGKELLEKLKGKSCFHISELDKKLEYQIEEAIKKGYKLYKKRGWV